MLSRCKWCNLNNSLYVKYHDEEWGVLNLDEAYLFEMLILESFQAGLSWEIILNKRDYFRICYDNFDINKVVEYDEEKVLELLNNENIVRNKLKIRASISNAKIFKNISREYGGFKNYLLSFFLQVPIYEANKITSEISDAIANDLKKRGMRFMGSIIVYSYLQAIGLINSHEKCCFMYKK